MDAGSTPAGSIKTKQADSSRIKRIEQASFLDKLSLLSLIKIFDNLKKLCYNIYRK